MFLEGPLNQPRHEWMNEWQAFLGFFIRKYLLQTCEIQLSRNCKVEWGRSWKYIIKTQKQSWPNKHCITLEVWCHICPPFIVFSLQLRRINWLRDLIFCGIFCFSQSGKKMKIRPNFLLTIFLSLLLFRLDWRPLLHKKVFYSLFLIIFKKKQN